MVEIPFLGEMIERNVKGSGRESGVVDKVIKATTGVSVKDIKRHGISGGKNSFLRKPFG